MSPPSTVEAYLSALARPGFDALTDGALLARFAADRDEASFTELVRRHAGMVHAVARRVLGGESDADDCAQAAFLVLAARAGRLAGRATVGDFLHGVAVRVALKARGRAARRRAVEARAARPEAVTHPPADDLAAAVDRAVQRLPRKLRDAVVLCDLEGLPRKVAAARLGVPEGTLSSRLTAAHKTLAGLLPAPAVALTLALHVPDAVAAMIVKTSTGPAGAAPAAVQSLATEVSTAMLIAKLKPAVLGVALLGLTATGAGVLQVAGGQDPKPAPTKADPAPVPAKPVATEVAATPESNAADKAAIRKKRDEVLANEGDSLQAVKNLVGNGFVTSWDVKAQTVNGRSVADTDGVRLTRLEFSNSNAGFVVTVYSEVRRFGRAPSEESETLLCVLNPHRTVKEMTLLTQPKAVTEAVRAGAGVGHVGITIPGIEGETLISTPVITHYIYELKGGKLRLATYKNWGEADRPHGFAVADQPKNGADLWVIELEREPAK